LTDSRPPALQTQRVFRFPAAAARSVEDRLGADGRLVLRYSGTEPLARVMIEGLDQPTIEAMAAELIGVIQGELGR
jgi:phosphoglucosamine mutase